MDLRSTHRKAMGDRMIRKEPVYARLQPGLTETPPRALLPFRTAPHWTQNPIAFPEAPIPMLIMRRANDCYDVVTSRALPAKYPTLCHSPYLAISLCYTTWLLSLTGRVSRSHAAHMPLSHPVG